MSTAIPDPAKCEWCGQYHTYVCPKVKSFEYEGDRLKRVEFFAPNDYLPAVLAKDDVGDR